MRRATQYRISRFLLNNFTLYLTRHFITSTLRTRNIDLAIGLHIEI
jgi:hypothetical protein